MRTDDDLPYTRTLPPVRRPAAPAGWRHLCADCWMDSRPTEYLASSPVDDDYCPTCGAFASLYATRETAR